MRLTVLLATLGAALLLAAPASAAPSWLAPGLSGAETPTTQSTGRIALGANGTAVAAWAQASGGTTVLQVSRRAPGGGFSAPLTVGGTTGAADVRVGVDGAGNATVLFAQGGQIRVLAWPAAAGAAGRAESLEAGGSPELAVGRGGTAVATWLENPATMTPRVRAAVRPGASGGFGAPATISDFGNGASSITGSAGRRRRRRARHRGLVAPDAGPQRPADRGERAGREARSPASARRSPTRSLPRCRPSPPLPSARPGARPCCGRIPARSSTRSTPRVNRSGATRRACRRSAPPPSMPAIAASPTGAFIAAWRSDATIATAARAAGGAAFSGFQTISGPSMNPSLPQVVAGGNGDALISWSLGDGKAIPTVQRKANGALGPILNAISAANPVQSFSAPSIGIDDQGNGVAAWTRAENRGRHGLLALPGRELRRGRARAQLERAARRQGRRGPPDGRRGERPRLAGVAELELRRRRDRDRRRGRARVRRARRVHRRRPRRPTPRATGRARRIRS